jgi:hypothetical protein
VQLLSDRTHTHTHTHTVTSDVLHVPDIHWDMHSHICYTVIDVFTNFTLNCVQSVKD